MGGLCWEGITWRWPGAWGLGHLHRVSKWLPLQASALQHHWCCFCPLVIRELLMDGLKQ